MYFIILFFIYSCLKLLCKELFENTYQRGFVKGVPIQKLIYSYSYN